MIRQAVAAAGVLLVVGWCGSANAEPAPGWRLAVHGTVARADSTSGRPASVDKTFDLALVLTSREPQGAKWLWLLEESGGGGWPWSDRFGAWETGPLGSSERSPGPALLFDRADGSSVISLMSPLLTPPVQLAPEATWSAGEQNFVVEQKEQRGERELWRVAVAMGSGRTKTLWLDERESLVRAAEQRIFMGQGEEHQLRWEIVATSQLSPEELASTAADHVELEKLRSVLGRPPRTIEPTLSAQQQTLLTAALPAAQVAVRTPALTAVVRQAERDLALQTERAGDVAELVAKFQGQPAELLALRGPSGESLRQEDLTGAVTLLHFWEYRDEPLREPYGQVGYLDFLFSKRQPDGLRVFGIAVDGRLGDERLRPAALQSVRKLRSFMNLSYPVVLDDGAALKQFGDPRQIGAALPLFVLVGRDGKIVHYHVGEHNVDLQFGLKDLNELVAQALAAETP